MKACCVPDCGQPRYVTPGGNMCSRCREHERERQRASNERKRAPTRKYSKRGRPPKPTHVMVLGDSEQVYVMPAQTETQKKMQAVWEKLVKHMGWEMKKIR